MMLRIVNSTREALLGTQVFLAETENERSRGLMFVPRLESGQGLLIPECNAIHTHGMSFSIDAVFLLGAPLQGGQATMKVLAAYRVPQGFVCKQPQFHKPVTFCLELPAGSIDATGTQPGDVLEVMQA